MERVRVPFVYCNLVGGNDELIFDGASLVLNAAGQLIAEGAMCREDFLVIDTASMTAMPARGARGGRSGSTARWCSACATTCTSAASSSRSSASPAASTPRSPPCIAVEALGADNVRGVRMPSRYSARRAFRRRRARSSRRISASNSTSSPIEPMFDAAYERTLAPDLRRQGRGYRRGKHPGAPARRDADGDLATSSAHLLLTTGNKSELAVGYCTLYGDMCGGLAVISDVPKTTVYDSREWINRERRESSRATRSPSRRAPSCGPNQTDQDSLPPYDVLDAILEQYVEEGKSRAEIEKAGFDAATVDRIVRLIDRNEYKRRQAAPGIKVTSRAFGFGRRMPIAQRYQEL